MPELMASVGMKANATNLLGFMISYLYGFILLIFPMLFCILRGNALIAKYVDKGSMVSLIAAPVKRHIIAFTQMKVLVSGILLLVPKIISSFILPFISCLYSAILIIFVTSVVIHKDFFQTLFRRNSNFCPITYTIKI